MKCRLAEVCEKITSGGTLKSTNPACYVGIFHGCECEKFVWEFYWIRGRSGELETSKSRRFYRI